MIEITTTAQDPDAWKQDREPLFSIDGQAYTIPRNVPTRVGLKALRETAQLGEVAASYHVMVLMLGQDGYNALEGCPDLSKGDLEKIQTIIRKRVFGDLEEEGKG